MEDELNFLKMEDDLNLKKMEYNLILLVNGKNYKKKDATRNIKN